MMVYLALRTLSFKEVFDKRAAFFGQNTADDFGAGLKGGRGEPAKAALGIRSSIDYPANLGPAQSTGTHCTGLKGYIEGAAIQVFTAKGLGG